MVRGALRASDFSSGRRERRCAWRHARHVAVVGRSRLIGLVVELVRGEAAVSRGSRPRRAVLGNGGEQRVGFEWQVQHAPVEAVDTGRAWLLSGEARAIGQ